jgi:UDP-N-acetylmuramate dehydrogenase
VSAGLPGSEELVWLRGKFGDAVRSDVPLAPYTSARIGGSADVLLEVRSAGELADAIRALWDRELAFRILGGGSNVLVADAGVREVVILNRARSKRFEERESGPFVWAESGVSLGGIARQSAERGWSGMEWAAGVPGTLGGAIVGNAGAHGGDMAGSLIMAEILQQDGRRESWPVERLEYSYRSSRLKRDPGPVVLAGTLGLTRSTPELCKAQVREYSSQRARSQPAGASMGSMFKNPSGDYAGRLLEDAGLKGLRIGNAWISEVHANFFVNDGRATAQDVATLIETARKRVKEASGVELELEIELIGDWGSAGAADEDRSQS